MISQKPTVVSQLSAQIKSGKLLPVYLFYGEEDFLKQYYLRALTVAFCGKGGEPIFFEGASFELDAFADSAQNVSFSAEGNMLVVRNLELNKALTPKRKGEFLELLSSLGEGVLVVLYYDAMFLSDASYEIVARRGEMLKSLSKHCFPCEFPQQSEAELLKWIPKALAANQLKITEKNALYLIDVVGRDMLSLRSEIDKIALAAPGAEVTAALIDRVISGNRESDVFGLARDVLSGRTGDALSKLSDCRWLKEEPVGVLSILATTFTEAALLKAGADSGERNLDELIKAFSLNPRKRRFFADYLTIVSAAGGSFLTKSLELILETDRKMKESAFDKWTLLESLCVRIALCRK